MLAQTSKRARVGVGLVALAAVIGGIFLATDSPGPGPATPNFGTQVGYTWQGKVKSLGATWTVPRMIGTSPCGTAGTWIGAQAPGSPGPFIQIGVNETCIEAPHHKATVFYEAFWSDTKLDFHPRFIFPVLAGDVISAGLAREAHRWALVIADHKSGKSARFTTHDETDGSFNWAEWHQEDVSQHGGRPFPYPNLSPVEFRSLRVNSSAPSESDLLSAWMTVGRREFKPTPLANSSFGIETTHVTQFASQYLRLAVADDAATEAFLPELDRWSIRTPPSQVNSERYRFAAALRRNVDGLARERWPANVGALVDVLIRRNDGLIARTLGNVPRSTGGLAAWKAAWRSQASTIGQASRPIPTAVGLPQTGPRFVSR